MHDKIFSTSLPDPRCALTHTEIPFSQKDHISKLAYIARESGLSYGQLQAQAYERMQRMSEEERKREEAIKADRIKRAQGLLPCPICGEYYKARKNKVACSRSCASVVRERRLKEEALRG